MNTAEWNNDLLVLRGNAALLKIGYIIIDLIETPLDSIDLLASRGLDPLPIDLLAISGIQLSRLSCGESLGDRCS